MTSLKTPNTRPVEVLPTKAESIALTWRCEPRPEDVGAVRQIVTSTGFFSNEEVDIAVELFEDRLQQGESSDYQFVLADLDGRPIGYSSFGRIAGTQGSYDLYWLAIQSQHQRRGIGKALLERTEQLIVGAKDAGRQIYVETSSRAQYQPTLSFYRRCGYRVAAVFEDFYASGDGKITLVKTVG